jgi:hypothetical protein
VLPRLHLCRTISDISVGEGEYGEVAENIVSIVIVKKFDIMAS